MIPLERYLAGLMPLARTISPYRAPPKVKPFHTDDFIRSLELSGPQLTSRIKGDWAALYRRFLKSPNFVGWYNARHAEVSAKLTLLHMECLSEARIESWMEGKAEVELVDMVLRSEIFCFLLREIKIRELKLLMEELTYADTRPCKFLWIFIIGIATTALNDFDYVGLSVPCGSEYILII